MKEEILSKLKSAEEETSRKTEAARARAQEIVKAAHGQAQEVLRNAEGEARRDQAAEIQAEKTRLEAERSKILATSKATEEKMRSAFHAKMEDSVRKAVEAFSRSLDA